MKLEFIRRSDRGLVSPAIKCRGREYLRIIYGPEYTASAQSGRVAEAQHDQEDRARVARVRPRDRAWDTALPRRGRTPVSLGSGAPVMLPGEEQHRESRPRTSTTAATGSPLRGGRGQDHRDPVQGSRSCSRAACSTRLDVALEPVERRDPLNRDSAAARRLGRDATPPFGVGVRSYRLTRTRRFHKLAAADVAARARGVHVLTQAGVDRDRALALVGWEE